MVGYAYDYATDHYTGWHQHPRAQLLHATSGTMRMATATALFIVPPGTGLWVPAHTEHVTRMPSGLAMRGLFLREDAARAGPDTVTVVAISPLLRALILAACEQPVMWDEDGPVRHVVALALHEIGHAAARPIGAGVQRSAAAAGDRSASSGPGRLTRARRLRGDGWRFSTDSRTALPTRDRHELSGMATTVAADRRTCCAKRRRDPGARRRGGRVQ